MANKKPLERKPTDQKSKTASMSASETGANGELTDSDMDAVHGGTGHCATGKHFPEVQLTSRKLT
jgi:hypothetical protein